MDTLTISYKRHRFPPEIIAHAVETASVAGPRARFANEAEAGGADICVAYTTRSTGRGRNFCTI
ncbi:MAG: hypothetical protein AAED33_14785 [Paracoccaceae bacterium]